MATHVTRCPHCQTTFRVKDEHLKIASGAVRCGSCLQVFKATEHLVDSSAAEAKTEPKPETQPEQKVEQASEAKTAPQPAAQPAAATQPQPAQPQPKQDIISDSSESDDDDGLIHDDMDDDDDDDDIIHDDPLVDFGIRAPEQQSRPKPRQENALDFEIDSAIFDIKNASSDTLDLIDPAY